MLTNRVYIPWTDKELDIIRTLGKEGKSPSAIQKQLPHRTRCSVDNKMQQLKKKEGWYNSSHVVEKYMVNNEFVKRVRPQSICDAFAGMKPYYNNNHPTVSEIVTNDEEKTYPTEYHMDAGKFLALMIEKRKTFDIVDIDPFGSSAKYIDSAIMLANKGLIVSVGDFIFKRFTTASINHAKMYGYKADSGKDITMDKIVRAIIKKARKMGKELKVFDQRLWNNHSGHDSFGRIWFLVRPIGQGV